MRFLGYPYSATGNSPSTGFSCIGFVSYVYRSEGINLPGDLGGALAFAPQVSFSSLLPGDVVYFQNTVWAGNSHAGIYVGGGRFINAEWYGRGVVISSFTNDPVDGNYWSEHYLGANRPWTGVTMNPAPAAPVRSSRPAPAPRPARVTAQLPAGPRASVSVPSLNVRSGPSTRYAVETAITRGTTVVTMAQSYGWYKVALRSGATGWVIGVGIGKGYGYVPRQGSSRRSTTSRYSAPRRRVLTRRATFTSRVRTSGSVTTRVNGLRVHSAPALGAAVVGSVYRGQRLGVVSSMGGWMKVLLPNSRIGWVSGLYVQSQLGRPGTQVRPVASRSVSGGLAARVSLNVRQNPSLTSAIVSILPPGGSYRVLGWYAGWAHVRLSSGAIGWISGSVLGTSTPATTSRSSATYRATTTAAGPVVTAGVRVHAGAGLSSGVIGLAAAGTHVRVLGSIAGWTRVRLPNGRTGYILGIYVRG